MTTESTTMPDLFRANLDVAFYLLHIGQQGRQRAWEFEMLRITRDFALLDATRKAVSQAHDWSDLASNCQTNLRDYAGTTSDLWQQGPITAARQQSVDLDGMRDALTKWQATVSANWQAGANITTVPWHEGVRQFEQSMRGALNGRPVFDASLSSAASPTAARGVVQKGEAYVA